MNLDHERFFQEATREAQKSLCRRGFCGAVIASKEGEIIGRGYNAPPRDDEKHRKCDIEMPQHPSEKPKSDRTCCMHAEWRALLDALRFHSDQVTGSTLYFVRINENGEMLFSGKPYCTVCSRLALDLGVAQFVLWHEDGIVSYSTDEYNNLSYQFFERQDDTNKTV